MQPVRARGENLDNRRTRNGVIASGAVGFIDRLGCTLREALHPYDSISCYSMIAFGEEAKAIKPSLYVPSAKPNARSENFYLE